VLQTPGSKSYAHSTQSLRFSSVSARFFVVSLLPIGLNLPVNFQPAKPNLARVSNFFLLIFIDYSFKVVSNFLLAIDWNHASAITTSPFIVYVLFYFPIEMVICASVSCFSVKIFLSRYFVRADLQSFCYALPFTYHLTFTHKVTIAETHCSNT
jgi:hypothetical protein